MKKQNLNILNFILFMQLLLPISHSDSCIAGFDRDIERNQFTFPEFVQGENFIVHYTSSDVDSQFVNGQWLNLQCNEGYAQSVLEHAESALSIFLENGWEDIPPDCDESIQDLNSPNHCINYGGNSLYDIYLSNDGVGMVVPETPYPVEPYTGGYTSFMKISTLLNQHESMPYWNFHVIAHELHHAIQLRYGYSVSGIKRDEKIVNGDIRKVIVSARKEYSTEVPQPISNIQYRLYVKQGTTEVETHPWTKVNRANNQNYFLIDTGDMIPNEYYLDIQAISDLEVNTYYQTLKFQVVNQANYFGNPPADYRQ